uniref:Uncharacterized protein n=1 Tax=Arundo donax TaxID=35708 RepID=A0A0A9DUW4_ARUDO
MTDSPLSRQRMASA